MFFDSSDLGLIAFRLKYFHGFHLTKSIWLDGPSLRTFFHLKFDSSTSSISLSTSAFDFLPKLFDEQNKLEICPNSVFNFWFSSKLWYWFESCVCFSCQPDPGKPVFYTLWPLASSPLSERRTSLFLFFLCVHPWTSICRPNDGSTLKPSFLNTHIRPLIL